MKLNHSPPSSADVKNEWICNSTTPIYAFVACTGTTLLLTVLYSQCSWDRVVTNFGTLFVCGLNTDRVHIKTSVEQHMIQMCSWFVISKELRINCRLDVLVLTAVMLRINVQNSSGFC